VANPQKENGYTALANEILDALIKVPLLGSEMQVCLFVIRKTYGFNKKEDAISITQLERAVQRSRPTIVKALKNLQLVNILKLVKKGNSKTSSNIYCLNKNYDEWKLVNTPKLVKSNNSTSKVNALQLVKIPKHTKDNTKDNTKDRSSFIPPNYIPKDTWQAYLKLRDKKKAAKTDYALKLIITTLDKINKEHGHDRLEVLNKSIKSGWVDVYPLKEGNYGSKDNRGYYGKRQPTELPDTEETRAIFDKIARAKAKLSDKRLAPDGDTGGEV